MALGKKGEGGVFESMGTITEIILLVVIAISFIAFASYSVTKTPVEVRFLSRELSMATTLASSSPGQLVLNFTPKRVQLERFNFVWAGSTLTVNDISGQPTTNYPYLWNMILFKGDTVLKSPDSIFFTNRGNRLEVSTLPGELGITLVCPESGFSPHAIFLDPGHGEETDSGEGTESETVCAIARQMNEILAGEKDITSSLPVYNIRSSRPVNDLGLINCIGTYRLDDAMIADGIANSELTLSIHLANNPNGKSVIRAFADGSEAKGLACKILNRILEENRGNVDAAILLSYPDNYPGTPPSAGKPRIILEIGNLQSLKTAALLPHVSAPIAGVLNE